MKFFVMDNDPFYVFIHKIDLMQKIFSSLSGQWCGNLHSNIARKLALVS